MIFNETKLTGAFIIDVEKKSDDRGFFGRTFCEKEFSQQNLHMTIKQANISHNNKKGILRGMHYQISPHAEAKIVSCARGAILDVMLDLRSHSPTYCQYVSVELTEENKRSVFVPEGFAHGFQTLSEQADVFYQMSEFYHPKSARGVRWDDPAFTIEWPMRPCYISAKDAQYPDYRKALK